MEIAAGNSQGSILPTLLLVGALFALMYFLIIRPQSKRRREQMELQRSVGAGAEIITAGGLYATVVDTDDESVILEISPGVNARYARGAIAHVRSNSAAETSESDLDDSDAESGIVEDKTPATNEYAEVRIDEEPKDTSATDKDAK